MSKIVIVNNIACENCGSFKFEIRRKGIHVGQYCLCCGKYVKWLSKKERNDLGIVISNKIQNNVVVKNLEENRQLSIFDIDVDVDDVPFEV